MTSQKEWWKNPLYITLITTIVSSIIPITSLIQGTIQKSKELELKKFELVYQIRMSYLDKSLSADTKKVLRFIVIASDDPKLENWAENEINLIDSAAAFENKSIKKTLDSIQLVFNDIPKLIKTTSNSNLIKQLKTKENEIKNFELSLKSRMISLNSIIAGLPEYMPTPDFSKRQLMGYFHYTGRLKVINTKDRELNITLYHPDAPQSPHSSYTFKTHENKFIADWAVGDDWGISVDGHKEVRLGDIAKWDSINHIFIIYNK